MAYQGVGSEVGRGGCSQTHASTPLESFSLMCVVECGRMWWRVVRCGGVW